MWKDEQRLQNRHGGLDAAGREQVQGRLRASAAVVHETIRTEGEAELARPTRSLFWSGLAAGLSMGFSLAVEGLLMIHMPEAEWRPLVANLGYTTGFVFVVLGRQQLFTENTLIVVLPTLHRRTMHAYALMFRLWAVVLTANVIGTFAFAAAAVHTDVFSADARAAFAVLGEHALAHDADTTFIKAIVAGWLIALMVWLLPESGITAVVVVIGVTYVVALADLSHIIAGSVEGFYSVLIGAHTIGDFALGFFLPTLAGNVIGGVTLVALLNHAQVSAEV